MIVEVEAAGEGDLGSGGEQRLDLGAALGGEEVAAVDHRRGQRAMVDPGAGARAPGRAGMALEGLGCVVAKELHAVAALDQRLPFGDKALELHRADLRAVLFLLAAPLRLLIVVELALEAGNRAVEEIDGRPEQLFEVGLEASVAQCGDEGVEDVGDGAGYSLRLRQRPRIGLVAERPEAIELEFMEDAVGRGRAVAGLGVVVMVGGHSGFPSPDRPRPSRPSWRRRRRAARTCTRSESEGPKPWRRMAKAGDFVSRWKAALWAAPENRRPQPLPVRAACCSIAL